MPFHYPEMSRCMVSSSVGAEGIEPPSTGQEPAARPLSYAPMTPAPTTMGPPYNFDEIHYSVVRERASVDAGGIEPPWPKRLIYSQVGPPRCPTHPFTSVRVTGVEPAPPTWQAGVLPHAPHPRSIESLFGHTSPVLRLAVRQSDTRLPLSRAPVFPTADTRLPFMPRVAIASAHGAQGGNRTLIPGVRNPRSAFDLPGHCRPSRY